MNFKNCKLIKKVITSTLPLALLAMPIPMNIAHADITKVEVLNGDTSVTVIDILSGKKIDYSTATSNNHKDSMDSEKAKGSISYNATDKKLTLEGVDLTATENLIQVTGANANDVIAIELKGDNKITAKKAAITATNASVKFIGDGTLTISQTTAGNAISAGNIDFEQNGKVTLTQNAAEEAIKATGALTLTSGTVNVAQEVDRVAVNVAGESKINGGHLVINQNGAQNGYNAAEKFTMSNGVVEINHKGNNGVGLNGKDVEITGGSLIAKINNKNNTGAPIAVSSTMTVKNADVIAETVGQAPCGITGTVEVGKEAVIIANGATSAVEYNNLKLDNSIQWRALAGHDEKTAVVLEQTAADEILDVLRLGNHDYLNLTHGVIIEPKTAVFDLNKLSKDNKEIDVTVDLNGTTIQEIMVDGKALVVDKEYKVATVNNTARVTFGADYLQSLAEGKHTLGFISSTGLPVSFDLEVVNTAKAAQPADGTSNTQQAAAVKRDNVPKTGDTTNIMPYVLLLSVGILTIIVSLKKRIVE